MDVSLIFAPYCAWHVYSLNRLLTDCSLCSFLPFDVFEIAVQRAVLNEDNTLSTVTEGTATLSTDARAVEEKTAAEFLNEYSKCISNPESMLM